MKRSFYARFAPYILLAFFASVPVLFVGARGALRGVNNDVRQWLPSGFEETRQYDWFLSYFGSDEMAVASWPGATLDDPRVNRFAEELGRYTLDPTGNPLAPSDVPKYFKSIFTGPSLVTQLTEPPLNLPRDEALRRLQGSLIGPDRETTALVAVLSDRGTEQRHDVLATLRRVAADVGIPPRDLHLAGPTVDSVSLDIESARSRNLLSVLSVCLALILAWRCLRDLRLVLIVFATALFSTAIAVTILDFTGGSLNLVMVMMPTLIYVLAVSGSIHLANYYQDIVAGHGVSGAPGKALAACWLPATLCAATTAVGLGSLAVSEVIPVRMFGIYSAIGTMTTLPVLFLFLPAALELWPADRRAREAIAVPAPFSTDQVAHWSHRPVDFLVRNSRWVMVGGTVMMVLFAVGLMRLQTSVRLMNMFSPNSRIIQDYTWMESHLGPLVPIELVLAFEESGGERMVDRLDLVNSVQDRLDSLPQVSGTLSAATFAARVPRTGGVSNLVQRRLLERHLERDRELFAKVGYLRDTPDKQLWRVSARVKALEDIDYGQFVKQLRQEVQPLLDGWAKANDARVQATFTGMVPLVYIAQHTLLRDLSQSFVTAFLLIALMMMALVRSVRGGLYSMLPNVFPAVVIFGGLGWLKIEVDIGSMMTASLALGIAVDDTIHLLNWYRHGLREGLTPREAIYMAYEHCAGAMMQTSMICGLGMLVFAFSSFVPTARFAWLMFLLLFVALLGDLILLPAMLAGRWGKFFARPSGRLEGRTTLAWDWLLRRWQQSPLGRRLQQRAR